MRVYKTAERYY